MSDNEENIQVDQPNDESMPEGEKRVSFLLPTLSGAHEVVKVTKEFLDQCAPIFKDDHSKEEEEHGIPLHGLLFEKHGKVIDLWDQDDQYDMLHASMDTLMAALAAADYLGHSNWMHCVSSEIAMRVSGMNRDHMAKELNIELDTSDPVLNAIEYLVQDVE